MFPLFDCIKIFMIILFFQSDTIYEFLNYLIIYLNKICDNLDDINDINDIDNMENIDDIDDYININNNDINNIDSIHNINNIVNIDNIDNINYNSQEEHYFDSVSFGLSNLF